MTSRIDELHAASVQQRQDWRDKDARDARAAQPPSTVSRTVSCATCGAMGITPACDTWDEADDWLDATGWQDIDRHPACPECAEGGAA